MSSMAMKGGGSTYNRVVVPESTALATASQQYWAHRQAQAEAQIVQFQASAFNPDIETNWKRFCVNGVAFLNRLLWRALDDLEAPLRKYWNGNKALARDRVKLFKAEAVIELLIPFSHAPLRFVRVSPKSGDYGIDATRFVDHVQEMQLGKPYVTLSWKASASL